MPTSTRGARVVPLVLSTMTSQALLVVLAPTMPAIGAELGASVPTVGQARTVTATVAVAASLVLTARIGVIGLPRLLRVGSVLTVLASAAVAAAQTLPVFLLAHALVGVALAAQLTAGFAGVAAFAQADRPWAIGHVAGANALAWIVVNPIAGAMAEWLTWRAAHAVPAILALASLLAAAAVAEPPEPPGPMPLRTLARDRYARRWMLAELLAYTCWTALLTFVGAYFVEALGVGESLAGWLLAAGAAAYFLAATRSAGLASRFSRRHIAAAGAVVMGALAAALLGVEAGVAVSAVVFCVIGVVAGARTPAASGLGLEQLPGHGGSMMAIRTAVTQLGYLLGAVIGGTVIALAGYSALGLVLAAGMALSAVLILRVREA